jgi:hypothetical protein
MPPSLRKEFQAADFRRIVDIVKATGGEVYGAGVRDLLLLLSSTSDSTSVPPLLNMQKIHCRYADNNRISILLSLLKMDYVLTSTMNIMDVNISIRCRKATAMTRVGPPPHHPTATTSLLPAAMITIHVSSLPRKLWRMQRPRFDVDILACNSKGIYAWPIPVNGQELDVADVMSRIHARSFSVLPQWNSMTSSVAMTLQESIEMVNAGWTMTYRSATTITEAAAAAAAAVASAAAATNGGSSSSANGNNNDGEKEEACFKEPIVFRWTSSCSSSGASATECGICQEAFQAKSVVVRLPCRHVFHGYCDATRPQAGGICKWFERSLTCPFCRHSAVLP